MPVQIVRRSVMNLWLALMLMSIPSLGQKQTLRDIGVRTGASFSQRQGSQPSTSSSYAFTVLDYPGTFYTYGVSMNLGSTSSAVMLVGEYGQPFGPTASGFLVHASEAKNLARESYQNISFPGAVVSGSLGVNDSGEIVGFYDDSAGNQHGYLLAGGKFSKVDVPFAGAKLTTSAGINNSGETVGVWIDSQGNEHGFSLVSGSYTSLDYPGASGTEANAVNNNGDIVGSYFDASGVEHGFLLSGGSFTSLDPTGSVGTAAEGINDSGEIVGSYCLTSACVSSSAGQQGFVLSKGSYTTIAIPGEVWTGVGGINNAGIVGGDFTDAAGYSHSFIALP